MSDLGPAPAGNALVERIKAILLRPKDEWPNIAARHETVADIYRSWVIPLAAIGPVAALIGSLVFGYGAFGIVYRPTVLGALITAVVSYAMTLGVVYVLALVIDGLAPNFGATRNRTAAFKVAAYGATAGWVAGIFGIIPSLSFLGILGLYSLYLIYTGLPVLMKAPDEKAIGYTAVVVVVMIVLAIVLSVLTAPIAALFGAIAPGTVSGSLNVPGAGSVDMSKIEEAGKKLEAATAQMQNGEGKPAIAPDVLQALLPATLPGGLSRTRIESASAGTAGIGGSNVEARYGSGDTEVTLTVTDLGAMGGLAALGSAFNVQSSKQDADGYEKVGKVDGRMTTEKYSTASRSGSYGTLIGDRIMVQAEGRGPSIDVFKGAVAAVDLSRAEALAGQ